MSYPIVPAGEVSHGRKQWLRQSNLAHQYIHPDYKLQLHGLAYKGGEKDWAAFINSTNQEKGLSPGRVWERHPPSMKQPCPLEATHPYSQTVIWMKFIPLIHLLAHLSFLALKWAGHGTVKYHWLGASHISSCTIHSFVWPNSLEPSYMTDTLLHPT
jgi:hypothetical protein